MKLSIITINYNNAEGLKRTLESITTLKNDQFEYIIIDGASTDSSVDIIKSYTTKIDYWISEHDRGIYHAMNKGIDKASGEYLLFINSGDELIKDTNINKTVDQLTGEDIISYNIKEVLDTEKDISVCKKVPDTLDFRYFVQDALPHQSTFIKRQVLIDYGGYSENMKIFSDWAFFMDAICKLGCTFKHIDDQFSIFYQDGISSKPENKTILWNELSQHIELNYPIYNRIYQEWAEQKEELHKLRCSRSINLLKKAGFIKWFKVYSK